MRTFIAILALSSTLNASGDLAPLRPPCVPLNVVSPYQSTWSCADNLYDAAPQHWTGDSLEMLGLMKVDGTLYRFMGANYAGEKTVTQKSVQVKPTTTVYEFVAGGVELHLSFSTPAIGLDDDITMASRPVTHVTFTLTTKDSQEHAVQLYIDSSAQASVQSNDEQVNWSRPSSEGNLTIMQIGTVAQTHLGQGSDRINWGYFMFATPEQASTDSHSTGSSYSVMTSADIARAAFANGTYTKLKDDTSGPRKAWTADNFPVLSMGWNVIVTDGPFEQRHFIMAYDQVVSMRYFGTEMPPLWRQRWPTATAMLQAAQQARGNDLAAASAFDNELVNNLTAVGGDKYATLASLVYRQVTGGTQAVWNSLLKEPWVFMKEISSDGDVSTVDVVYPSFPMFQYLYPEYFRRTLVPLLVYGNNETKPYGQWIPYNLSWAPHHLGHWPISDLPAEKQEQMPVEESGNMLIMLAGLFKVQKSLKYLLPYWHMLNGWADFIVASLPDPGNQLCTDDFEGPSPHNVNLAAKGIVALEAYAGMLDVLGDYSAANKYRSHAFAFAKNWTALAADKDHYRIQFNLPGTWSMKYNLLWQKVLGLKAFPEAVFANENKYYQTKLMSCGVAMDDRHNYTKTDWSLWTASMADTKEQFESITNAVFNFANSTPDRAPLADWYDVTNCKMKGFRARPVQGGFYAKMLVPTLSASEIIIL